MRLVGKVALVSGGLGGFGQAVVRAFQSEGAIVCVMDCNTPDSVGAQTLLREEDLFCKVDLTEHGAVEEALAVVNERLGGLDILVNNAGILYSHPLVTFESGKLTRHSVADWQKVLSVNLTAPFVLSSLVAEGMIKRRIKGSIVNITSISAAGNMGQSAYSAAKAGLEALTRTWAKELGMWGIRVSAVAPGFCDTDSTHAALAEPILKDIKTRTPLRRLGTPIDVAEAVLFCVTNEYFHGRSVEIDGGYTI